METKEMIISSFVFGLVVGIMVGFILSVVK